ncbi:DUF4352 domain-containing protein [Nakamurella sp. YIM 132087]|uniref:DUF4352 domain-containing protein n=1 Tax=Nakamurella alba TaxID=2665158 RepID=A0A7K1FHI0_9ACTN|nr:DUF4352 domain-containing protein [Nakamurella alba]MTD12743.1 DUF4352 domain-containing protein [Nakamurella alba]
MNPTTRRRAWRVAFPSAALATALLLTACTSAESPATSSSTAATTSSAAASGTAGTSATTISGTGSGSVAPSGSSTSGGAQPSGTGSASPSATSGTTSDDLQTTATRATTPVAPTSPGNIDQTVPSRAETTAPAVDLTETGNYGNGVTVLLDKITAVETAAELPGEVAGPGVRIDVSITNDSDAAIDLGNVVVDLQDKDGGPATFMTADPSAPFSGSLPPGETASAVYVFTIPATDRSGVTVTVRYSIDAPVVVFTGDAQ